MYRKQICYAMMIFKPIIIIKSSILKLIPLQNFSFNRKINNSYFYAIKKNSHVENAITVAEVKTHLFLQVTHLQTLRLLYPQRKTTKKTQNPKFRYRQFLSHVSRSRGHPLTWPSMTRQKNTPSSSGGSRSRRARVPAGPPWVPMTSADPDDRKREESALRGSDFGQRSRICFVAVAATSCIFEKFPKNFGPSTRPVQSRNHTELWVRTKGTQ